MKTDIIAGLPGNIISGLLGAFLVWCLTKIVQHINDYRIKKQFPLDGNYLSTYDDEIDGKKIVQKATAHFKQTGTHIIGRTTNFGEERTWHFRLTIEKSKFIHGVYGPKDPRDSSTGVIFLELQPNGSLEGLWAGFDSRNERVEGGKYSFVRTRDFKIAPLQHGIALKQALDILRSNLGERYFTLQELERYIGTDQCDRNKKALVAQDKATGEVIGVILAELVAPEALASSFLDSYDLIRNEPTLYRLRNQTTGLIKSVAVDIQARGNGIATQLVQHSVAELTKCGAKTFYALGWITEQGGCHIQGVLESLDFIPVKHFEKFWHNDSIAHKYDCPTCGHPCICSAMLFVKE